MMHPLSATLRMSIPIAMGLISSAHAAAVDFQQDILPLLADRCFACHGPDGNQRKGDLRLDIEAEAKKAVIVAGQPDASELLKRIGATDPDDHMPPSDSGKAALSVEQIALFRAWIADGAVWEGHWAYTPAKVTVPAKAKNTPWTRDDIDGYILARLKAKGLTPSSEATRETLIRRLSLDLTGLPPTLVAIDDFLLDNSNDAYENLVDSLLASPAYGEHMAQSWLDGARYADTNGHQNDFHRIMWPWRDWVIGAFNDNMPYDQFVVEQLAGDLLPEATESQRIATGFNRNNKTVTEGGSIEEEWLVENLVDRVETTATMFLGLTMGCARCHDHKYDPISQREFYEFYAFFNSTEDKGFYNATRGNAGPQILLPTYAQQQELQKMEKKLAALRADLETARVGQTSEYDPWIKSLRDATPAAEATAPVFEAKLRGSLPESALQTSRDPSWTTGVLGSALALDGSAEATLNLSQAVTFDRESPFSVALWVRPDGEGALFSKMDEANAMRGVDTYVTDRGEIITHLVNTWDKNALKTKTGRVLRMGTWTHICVTYDGSSKAAGIKVYVNGHAVPTKVEKDTLTGPIDTSEALRLGQRTSSLFLKGAITGFQVFDQALTAEAIAPHITTALAAALPADISEEQDKALRGFLEQNVAVAVRPQQEAYNNFEREHRNYKQTIPGVMVMQERAEPRPTFLLKRGAYDAPDTSEQLYPSTPDFLHAMGEGLPRNRLGLAQWLVDPANPLTARVATNRLWQMVFGRGFVKTAEDFGLQGSPPTHPLLLDALSVRFVESGWDVKGLLKSMVMSATYRQSSVLNADLLAADPENILYARAPRYRLSAEMIRDSALAASGLLSKKRCGPPAMPYQPLKLWEELAGGASQGPYKQDTGENLHRRSIYTHRKRTVPHPTLSTFDAPSFEYCLARRARTNTPLQALALLNDTTYVEAARHLAQRMLTEVDGAPEDRIEYGFRLATGRRPTASERTTLATGLAGYMTKYGEDSEAAANLVANGDSPAPEALQKDTLAAYMTVAGVLLNLDETITRE